MSSDGEVQGVGLLIASDPHNGRLVVLASISGGPADRAGVQAGDEACLCSGCCRLAALGSLKTQRAFLLWHGSCC